MFCSLQNYDDSVENFCLKKSITSSDKRPCKSANILNVMHINCLLLFTCFFLSHCSCYRLILCDWYVKWDTLCVQCKIHDKTPVVMVIKYNFTVVVCRIHCLPFSFASYCLHCICNTVGQLTSICSFFCEEKKSRNRMATCVVAWWLFV